ncbi:Enoyl-[acyl-carrier-protein] reductase [FMN] (EC [Olavius algarvensis Delta 1 endosymbiont]|nr:Enoyl-[acyl-carrier-protein] reductase [FMN] (EC [Olavius algarvensis Delta 1 endosymbiont]
MSIISEMLGCRYPVIQGAMGVISNLELVSAVSEAGGFGQLATAFATDPEAVREQIRATRQLTDKPFGANLHAMNPLAPQFAQIMAEEDVAAVTVSGGSPKELVPLLHRHSIKVIVVVPAVSVARKAESLGVDAIVAEGSESGGMQGFNGASTLVLVPAVVDAVKVPVIAAGGIGDSRGYKAALALGAQGVQIGTRFIATQECIAHANYKNYIIDSPENSTRLVNMGRFQVRALNTPLVEQMMDKENSLDTTAGASLEDAWVKGDLAAGTLPAGQVSGLISRILSVREVIEKMIGR